MATHFHNITDEHLFALAAEWGLKSDKNSPTGFNAAGFAKAAIEAALAQAAVRSGADTTIVPPFNSVGSRKLDDMLAKG